MGASNKPPWMRWATYNQLETRADEYDQKTDAEFTFRANHTCYLWQVRGGGDAEAIVTTASATFPSIAVDCCRSRAAK